MGLVTGVERLITNKGLEAMRVTRRLNSEAHINLRKIRRWFADEPQDAGGDAGQDGGADKQRSEWFNGLPKEAQDEIKRLREESKQHRLTARELEKRLKDFDAKAKAADDEKLTANQEYQKLAEKYKSEAEQAAKELAQLRVTALRERIARKNGLPDELAARLRGDTEDEINADAVELAKLIKPADEKGKKPGLTAVPGGSPSQETHAMAKARIYGRGNTDIFRGNK